MVKCCKETDFQNLMFNTQKSNFGWLLAAFKIQIPVRSYSLHLSAYRPEHRGQMSSFCQHLSEKNILVGGHSYWGGRAV